jgi:hypothetical protein
MKAPLRPMLLVLGALSLGGVFFLKNAEASQPSTIDTSAEALGGKDGGGGWVTLGGKEGGSHVELGGKDGGTHVELGGKEGGSHVELGGKDGGSHIELGGKEGGSHIELSTGGDK